jgi:hypothetical protein
MQIMRNKKTEPALRPHQLYVLAMLREIIEVCEAESKSPRGHLRGNINEPKLPKPSGNHRHDESGYRALMGYV